MARKQNRLTKVISPQNADDFRRIKGIGTAHAGRLFEAGIHTYHQLASLTPAELAVRIDGLSETKIAHQDWIGQARKLSSQKGFPRSLKKESSQRELRQHYENFTLEFLLDDKHTVKRTCLAHIQSGDTDTWAGWEVELFVDFLARHAGVRVPAIQKGNLADSRKRSRISQIPTIDTDTKRVEIPSPRALSIVEPIAQTAKEFVAPVIKAPEIDRLTGKLCLRNLEVIPKNSDSPVSFLQQDQSYIVRLHLDLTELGAPGDSPLILKASIVSRQLGGLGHNVGEIISTLKYSENITLEIDGTHLPPGAHRLEAMVEVKLDESVHGLTTSLKGSLLQVY